MPTFIDMSALTKRTTLTGNEEFQVSATEKVTAQQIADLASTGIQTVTVTNFKTNIWNDDSGSNIFSSVPVGGMVVFKSAVDATSGPGEALIGYAIKSSSLMASYVGMTQSNGVSMIPTLYTNKSSSIYDTKWQKLPDDSNVITPIEVTDFSLIGESLPANLTPGMIIPFYTGSEVYSYPGAETKYTGFIQLGTEYATSQFASVFAIGYAARDYATGNVYVGQLDITAQNIDWTKNKMAPAVVSAFTESVFSNLFYVGTAGELIAFSAPNATKNTNNQYPGNGAWHGIACQGYGGYTHIIAFNSNSAGSTGEAYIGLCIGSTTQWTALGGGGSAEPIVVADAESVATVVAAAFPKFEYGKIRPIYIEATSDIYDQLPAIQNVGFISGESTICGYAQCVYDGGDYYHIGIDLLLYPSSGGFPKYRAELVITNSGDIADSSITPIGSYLAPIPGFTKIASETDFSMTAGSMGIINFNTEVTSGVNVYMFVMAEVRSSAAPGADVRSVAIPLTFFNPVQGATVFDLNTRTLASGTNVAQVRLNVASVVTGSKGTQGLNCVVTSNNLANPSDILRIKAVYANI